MQSQLERGRQRLGNNSHALDTVSPLATLGRGYAIVQSLDGTIVRTTAGVKTGQQITARLGQGRLNCTVDSAESQS